MHKEVGWCGKLCTTFIGNDNFPLWKIKHHYKGPLKQIFRQLLLQYKVRRLDHKKKKKQREKDYRQMDIDRKLKRSSQTNHVTQCKKVNIGFGRHYLSVS